MIDQQGVITDMQLTGSAEQQRLAAEVFKLMVLQGWLFADDAPIRQTLGNLATFVADREKRDRETVAQELDVALRANANVFAREERDGEVIYTTSKLGSYQARVEDGRHMFKQRLYEPEAPLPLDDISVVVSTTRPALTTVEPVYISDYWQIQAGLTPVSASSLDSTDVVDGISDDISDDIADGIFDGVTNGITNGVVEPADSLVTSDEEPEPEQETIPVIEVVPTPQPVQVAPVQVAEPVAEPIAEPVAEVARPTPVSASSTATFTLPDGTAIDLNLPVETLMQEKGSVLERALAASIERDPLSRIVTFGRSLYPQASMVNLGKNDLRRIRDYILEVGEPLLDTTIIADLYYHNPRQADYEGFRFSLNYRLSREKDFEFVGVEGARLWSTKGLPTVGTKRVKASEMGQLTSFVEEGYDDSLQLQSAEAIQRSGSVTRLLTFFEWEYGMLPLDDSLTALLPALMLPEQRSAVLRFESPQHYTNYLVEMRTPTGSRGGWLQGLEDFFHDHLVPGALLTLTRTEEPNVFTITYEEQPATEDRLLTLDEKKNKLAFTNVTYYCAVDEDQLINQQHFGKLRNLKSFPMSERRKADQMLEHIFETAGDQLGSRNEPLYWMKLDDLFVAANVLRPFSRAYLQALLSDDESYYADESAPGAYFYKPEQKTTSTMNEDDTEEEEEIPTPRRGGRRYQDDDE